MTVSFQLAGRRYELAASQIHDVLSLHHPEPPTQYWVEIDGARWPVKQVLALVTGLDRSEFQSQSSRRVLHKLGFEIGKDDDPLRALARPRRAARPLNIPARAETSPSASDVVLIGCVKSKLTHGAPAQDLYTSNYFRKMRAYAEQSRRPWYILSAEHGLVSPNSWLEPYNCYLKDMSLDYRLRWGRKVADQLEGTIGSVDGLVVEIHAGSTYVSSVGPPLRTRGAVVDDRLNGLKFGHRLAWYKQHDSSAPDSVRVMVEQLGEEQRAVVPSDYQALGRDVLASCGMYSWWVDAAGAHELSAGLGHTVAPGLIYVGQAGATRSGGSASSNTLRVRIDMHLGRRHDLSTLRRSLGSVLAHAHGWDAIDEVQLTRWMHEHLRLTIVPVADADTLNALEGAVLGALDPPLNLARVDKTPLRARLTSLRAWAVSKDRTRSR